MNTKAVRLTSIMVLLSMMMVVFAGCGQKEAAKPQEETAIPVTVGTVGTGDVSSKTIITGKVTPMSEVAVIPKVMSPLKALQVPVDVGSPVKKGALLVKLDTTDLEISLSSALNGLQNSKLTHNQALLNFNNAKANFERMQSLYTEGAISKQQLEQAELQYNLAKDALNQPVVASAQNQIDNIRNQIANATITSPIDGEVAARFIDPGEMASGAQPAITVVNIDKVFVEGTVAERDVALVKEGQKVSVKVDAAGGTFEGTVKIVSPVANPQTKGYPVKIEINNPEHKLKPGMFAEIQMVTAQKKGVLVIPKEVLVTRGSDKKIYVVKENVVEERLVETGIEADELVEIVKGLAAGEKYVTEGQQSLFDKAKVTVRSSNEAK